MKNKCFDNSTDEIDLVHIIYKALKYRWLFIILIFIGMFIGGTVAHSKYSPPITSNTSNQPEYQTGITFMCDYYINGYNNYYIKLYCNELIKDLISNKIFIDKIITQNQNKLIKFYNLKTENNNNLNSKLHQILNSCCKLDIKDKGANSYVISYSSQSKDFNTRILKSIIDNLNIFYSDYVIKKTGIENDIKQTELKMNEAEESIKKILIQQKKENEKELLELKKELLNYYQKNKTVLENYSEDAPYNNFPTVIRFDEMKKQYDKILNNSIMLANSYEQSSLTPQLDNYKNVYKIAKNKYEHLQERLFDYRNLKFVNILSKKSLVKQEKILQVNNKNFIYLFFGGILGFLLSCLIVFLIETGKSLRHTENEDLKKIAALFKKDFNRIRLLFSKYSKKKK